MTAQALHSALLDSQDSFTLQQVWSNIDADSCPTQYNFHMHTTCSDGRLQPEQLLEQAISIGLKGLAITDHHSVRGYQIAQTLLTKMSEGGAVDSVPHLWTGVEVTSQLLDAEVHILGYAFDPSHVAMKPYLQGNAPRGTQAQAMEVIATIHQAGGLVVLAHPERYRRSAVELIPAAVQLGIDGVETYYAYRNTNPWKPSPGKTQIVQKLSEQYDLFNTCGTDTHGLNLLVRI